MNNPTGESVVYGVHPVTELVQARPNEIERVYFRQGRQAGPLFELLKDCRSARIPYQVVPPEKIDYLARGGAHQGVVALCAARPYESLDDILRASGASGSPGLLLVPASVEDPRNLGAIVRSAVAFGVDGIALERRNTAPLTDVVVKSSAGMIEHARIARPRSLEAAIGGLRETGWQVVGASADGDVTPERVDFKRPTVLVVGGEHAGVPAYLRKLCDVLVRIPLDPRVQSLNVSVATGILLYECSKQRRGLDGEQA